LAKTMRMMIQSCGMRIECASVRLTKSLGGVMSDVLVWAILILSGLFLTTKAGGSK